MFLIFGIIFAFRLSSIFFYCGLKKILGFKIDLCAQFVPFVCPPPRGVHHSGGGKDKPSFAESLRTRFGDPSGVGGLRALFELLERA